MSPTYENTAMTLPVSECMDMAPHMVIPFDFFQPSVCASLIKYAEALQDPKTGIQMQERLVVNQTKRVFTGWPVH